MPVVNDIECSIYARDGALQEFPCLDAPSPNTVYVQARDGQHFSIRCNVPFPYAHMPGRDDGLTFHVEIDGVHERPTLLDHKKLCISIDGTRVANSFGDWELRKFMFSSVELTEEDNHDGLTLDKIKRIGEIKVLVRRFRKTGGSTLASSGDADRVLGMKRTVIHEKTAKGRDVSHSVQRAKGELCEPVNSISGIYFDRAESPYMTFRFIYKSERALKNMDLIPRSPSPPPLRSRTHTVKPETPRFKRERSISAGPSKRAKTVRANLRGIKIIDLTGDD